MLATETASILIVDDTPVSLRLLEGVLQLDGHRVSAFPEPNMALRAAVRSPPDLILLDACMPGMSGFELCERLKGNTATQHVPVIFISGLTDIEEHTRALKAGGADFITKPFQFEEVRARVSTQLELIALRRRVETERVPTWLDEDTGEFLLRETGALSDDERAIYSKYRGNPALGQPQGRRMA